MVRTTAPTAFLSGLLFSFGLILSGMIQPAKVQAFLDVTGAWNPALGVVLLSALITAAPAFYWLGRNKYKTLLGKPSAVPRTGLVNGQLIIGSVILGVGWGLSGFDPGPGLIMAVSGNEPALIFLFAMAGGIYGAFKLDMYLAGRRRQSDGSLP